MAPKAVGILSPPKVMTMISLTRAMTRARQILQMATGHLTIAAPWMLQANMKVLRRTLLTMTTAWGLRFQ